MIKFSGFLKDSKESVLLKNILEITRSLINYPSMLQYHCAQCRWNLDKVFKPEAAEDSETTPLHIPNIIAKTRQSYIETLDSLKEHTQDTEIAESKRTRYLKSRSQLFHTQYFDALNNCALIPKLLHRDFALEILRIHQTGILPERILLFLAKIKRIPSDAISPYKDLADVIVHLSNIYLVLLDFLKSSEQRVHKPPAESKIPTAEITMKCTAVFEAANKLSEFISTTYPTAQFYSFQHLTQVWQSQGTTLHTDKKLGNLEPDPIATIRDLSTVLALSQPYIFEKFVCIQKISFIDIPVAMFFKNHVVSWLNKQETLENQPPEEIKTQKLTLQESEELTTHFYLYLESLK